MELREATSEDVADIRRIALNSLEASYGDVLGEDRLAEAVDAWYGGEELEAELADERALFLVAVEDDRCVGFTQCYVTERRERIGEIDWLHVEPDHRGRGIGSRLLEGSERALLDRGVARLEGRVLAANDAGTTFYRREGFTEAGEHEVRIGEESFRERLYVKYPDRDASQVLVEARTGPDGDRLYVAFDDAERGSRGSFHPAYLDREQQRRYGWFCGGCESFDVAMDTMDRIECNDCGNRRKPTRWDAAYL